MTWKCFFYARDGFVLEKEVYDLEPEVKDKVFTFKTFSRTKDNTLDILKIINREFVCVAAFTVHGQKTAYYEEII